ILQRDPCFCSVPAAWWKRCNLPGRSDVKWSRRDRMTQTATDVAVVGGGLAGLAAAAYLGRAGRKVTLFERSRSLGGRAATHENGGFRFNIGPHALYR